MDGTAPILAALDRPDHAGRASASQRATIARWIATGTSLSGGGVHPAGFANPRSAESHLLFLRERRYAPLLDPNDPDACASCHGDAAPAGTGMSSALQAPACSTCHTEGTGVLACPTCHGAGTRRYPPRDPCFFPAGRGGAHAAHVETGKVRADGLPCTACHPTPAAGSFTGTHADGHVDVAFDPKLVPTGASFGDADQRCTGTCHARGGARPAPAWTETGPLGCNDCHLSPPRDHYGGACTACHHEANADGSALTPGPLHVNGKIDLGDGSGRCGACHGNGEDPWPSSGAHAAHARPRDARPVPCESCHEVPRAGDRHPGGRGGATVRFASLATTGGRRASYDPVTKTCAGTYCHESRGGHQTSPSWSGTISTRCAACHSSPPPPPHVQSATCGGSSCHEGRTDGLAMTALGRKDHVNGLVDRTAP